MVMLNATNVKSETELGGKGRVDAGYFHAVVNFCEEKASKTKGTPGVSVEFQIVCDGVATDKKTPVTGQAGKTISAFYSSVGKDEEASKRCNNNLTRLALATGIMDFGESIEPDWAEAIGRELIIHVVDETKEETDANGEKKWVKTGYTKVDWFGFWKLSHPEVSAVPRDATSPGMQAVAGNLKSRSGPDAPTAAKPANGNGGNGNGHNQPAAATTTASPTRKKWADL